MQSYPESLHLYIILSREMNSMMYKYILGEMSDHIQIITMNFPENMNKLSIPLMEEIIDALGNAENDDECRVVILTASGEYFCGGGELGDYRVKSSMEIRKFGDSLYRLHATIARLNKPVIAAVQGHAFGGGMSLVEACDLAAAADGVFFAIPEVKSGLSPMVSLIGACQILSRKRIMEMAFLGETISTERAIKEGLINWSFNRDELMEKTMYLARKLCENNPSAIGLCKKLYRQTYSLNYESKLQCAVDTLVSLLKSEDAEEVLRAKEEERNPFWKNK